MDVKKFGDCIGFDTDRTLGQMDHWQIHIYPSILYVDTNTLGGNLGLHRDSRQELN